MPKFIFPTFCLAILLVLTSCENYNYSKGKRLHSEGNYEEAINQFAKVEADDEEYDSARIYLAQADSLLAIQKREQFVKDSLLGIEQARLDSIAQIRQDSIALAQEIAALKDALEELKSYSPRETYSDIVDVLGRVSDIDRLGRRVKSGRSFEDSEVKRLTGRLEANLRAFQSSFFPNARKQYAAFADKNLWEMDIDVECFGNGNKIIRYTGGTFAANSNIKQVQQAVQEGVTLLRFSQTRYRWNKYAEEYTYYSLNTDGDRSILALN